MPQIYTEFDSTPQTIVADIKAAILTCSDWTAEAATNFGNVTTNAAIAATSLTMSGGTTGIVVGSVIRIGTEGGATTEYKNVTAVTATTVSFQSQGLVYAQPSGTTVYSGNAVVKATTTRGAAMILDLVDTTIASSNHGLAMAVYRTLGGDKSLRWLYWRATSAAPTMQVHVIVSASKEHLFISVEGPRANEALATSAVVGSLKNYFFIADMIPYHGSDAIPVVFAGGGMAATATSSPANNSHQGNFSRNFGNNSSWSVAKLLTLDFPSTASTETVQVTRQTSADGKYYLSPYVAFGDESGIRGRLANFFHVGFTYSDTPEIPTAPINQKIQYDGKWYKLLAVSKSDGSVATWGQFGSAGNNSVTNFYRSPIVAVPTTAP